MKLYPFSTSNVDCSTSNKHFQIVNSSCGVNRCRLEHSTVSEAKSIIPSASWKGLKKVIERDQQIILVGEIKYLSDTKIKLLYRFYSSVVLKKIIYIIQPSPEENDALKKVIY